MPGTLIADNKRSRAAFLDLGNCGLTAVPSEVGELVWLESLTVADEWSEWDGRDWRVQKSQNTGRKNDGLIDINSVGQLAGLQTLNITGTRVGDLAPLAGMSALQALYLSNTQVSDLFALAQFIAQGCPVRGVRRHGQTRVFASRDARSRTRRQRSSIKVMRQFSITFGNALRARLTTCMRPKEFRDQDRSRGRPGFPVGIPEEIGSTRALPQRLR